MAKHLSIITPDDPQFESFVQRFWKYTVVSKELDACWSWKASKSDKGYGIISVGSRGVCRRLRAHRVSWLIHYGLDPGNLLVCHACDNPECCNPRHLFLGTSADNTQDMIAKGRASAPPLHEGDDHPLRKDANARFFGEDNGMAKYTSDLVMAVFRSSLGTAAVARALNVPASFVADVRKGRTWRHLTGMKDETDKRRRS